MAKSKWFNEKDYETFVEEKVSEQENEKEVFGFARKWPNPEKGSQDKAKVYDIRFLPAPEGGFYKKYMYHGFYVGEEFKYILCNKTFGMDHFCPWCAVTSLLWKGSQKDKARASSYKRKERFVGNIYVNNDPRDADIDDDERKLSNKTFLYEFPATIEGKLKNEMTDKKMGYGPAIFDPENGYDFVIKVKSKKPDKDGKIWPDYNDSMFARQPSAIADSEEDIKAIMEDRQNIEEYIENMKWSWEQHVELLKAEMLWDDIADEFERSTGIGEEVEQKKKAPKEEKERFPTDSKDMDEMPEPKDESSISEDEDMTEDDILAKLKTMDL